MLNSWLLLHFKWQVCWVAAASRWTSIRPQRPQHLTRSADFLLLLLLLLHPVGALAGCYESLRFKSKAKAPKLAALHLMGLGGSQQQLEAGLQAGACLAAGNFMTRWVLLASAEPCAAARHVPCIKSYSVHAGKHYKDNAA